MTPCAAIDDYLADALAGDERQWFTAHLSRCPDCRQAVQVHERLANILFAAVEQERMPVELTDRIRGRIRGARRRRLAVATGALAAAIAAMIWLRGLTGGPPPTRLVPPAPVAARPADPVHVTFPTGDVIALREPMTSPNATFIWVYPRLGGQSPPVFHRSRP